MSIDERLRRALPMLEEPPVHPDDDLTSILLARGHRIRARRRAVAVSGLVVAVLAASLGALGRLTRDDRNSVVAGPRPLSGESWRSLPEAPISPRHGHSLVWTGREVVVWGGSSGDDVFDDGAAYDPAADTWRRIADAPLAPRDSHMAVWTGQEMVVVGGLDERGGAFVDGAAYDPATDTWRAIAALPVTPRGLSVSAWTGSEVLVVGGLQVAPIEAVAADGRVIGVGSPGGSIARDGAAYDPAGDSWRLLPPAPVDPPGPRPQAAWTGSELVIVESGLSDPGETPSASRVAAYGPARDSWRLLPPAPFGSEVVEGPSGPLVSTPSPKILWTGSVVLALVPGEGPGVHGGAYDPATDAWAAIDTVPPRAVSAEIALWTGREAVLWNGDGITFDPAADRWRELPDADHDRRELVAGVWTGQEAVFWGGWKERSNGKGLGDGFAYRPPVEPRQEDEPSSPDGAP